MTIDFKGLASDLQARARTLLPHWFPDGVLRGHEFKVGSLNGERGDSLSINVNTGKWSDFASGDKGGDLISLYAAMHRLGPAEAARELGAEETPWRQLPAAPAKDRTPDVTYHCLPAPAAHDCRHPKFGAPVRTWAYRNAAGELLGYVARYEPPGERKQIVPFIWAREVNGSTGEPRWHMKQFPDPRPLYGLDRLAERPDAPVLITEGEKACDAAGAMARVYVAMAWPGGAKAWRKTDFSPLAGRKVLLWPDADVPGIECMAEIAQHLLETGAAEVKVIDPSGQPDGWDAADAQAEGWDWPRFKGWAVPRVSVVVKKNASEPEPDIAQDLTSVGPVTRQIAAAAIERELADGPHGTSQAHEISVSPRPEVEVLPPVEAESREVIVQDEILPASYTEDAVAELWSESARDDYRYVNAWGKWMEWKGQRWRHENTLNVVDMVRQACRAMSQRAERDQTLTGAQQRAVRHAMGRANTVMGIERLAKADRRHAATSDQWDADPWLLNTPGGVVDLRTGRVEGQRRDAYMTKITSASPGGSCEAWQRFLDVATAGDRDLQEFMQRFAGYSLTGLTREHILVFVYGPGGNGKGTFINTLQWIMGDYATTAPMDMFCERKHEAHSTELADLMGARLVCAQETEEGKRWAEAKIKAMTGGDRIKARFMQKDFFEYTPHFKLLFAGNHKPGLRNVDEAMRRRLRLVPFDVEIPAAKRDQQLGERLRTEAGGILQWAIDGCLKWQREGFNAPPRVMEATSAYLTSQDQIGLWLEECTEKVEMTTCASSGLYESYRRFAERSGEFALPQKRWAQQMEQRGFRCFRARTGTVYRDIQLKVDDHGDSEWQ